MDERMKLFKWLTIPSGEKAQVQAYEVWQVRWRSRFGEYSGETRPEVECFTTNEDAERFAKELRAAMALIRHTSNTRVHVEKSEYKGT